MKRIISCLLILVLLLGSIPITEIVAYAAEETKITKITVTKFIKNFNNKSEAYYSVLIYGNNLDGIGVGVRPKTGSTQIVPAKQNPIIKNEFIAPASDDYESQIYITHNGYLKTSINVELPDINSIDPPSGIVDTSTDSSNSGIKLNVSGKTSGINANLYQGSNFITLSPGGAPINSYTIVPSAIKEKSGSWNVSFKKDEESITLEGGLSGSNGTDKTVVNVESQYTDIFSFRKKLDISDDILMFPTQGPKGTKVTLKADKLLPNMSIFLLKNKDDAYTKSNMVLEEDIIPTPGNGTEKPTVTFKVPSTLNELGSYYVVLTNKVDPKSDIKPQINSYKIIENPQFILVDSDNSVKLDRITPTTGSIKGIDAELRGMNIGRISKDIYDGIPDIPPSESDPNGHIDISNSEKMVVKYKEGKYNGKEVKTLTREIQVFVGGIAKFREGSDLTKDVFDYINIRVPENNDPNNLVKNVYVEIKTHIKYEGVDDPITITEADTLENGFTYLPLDYVPKITSIAPNKIPVDSMGKVTKSFNISIMGENFLKYRYIDGNGNIKFKIPEVDILNQSGSKNWFDNDNIKVYDRNGNELDGTEGRELGSRMTVTVKEGSYIPDGILNNPIDLRVTNPLKIEGEGDQGSYALGKVTFVEVQSDKTPVITSVTPNTVTVDGEKGVIIKGSNFDEKVAVYLDGEKLSGIKRDGVGTEIIFDAPKKPEGVYQIIIQNEEGGIATFDDFIYVKTYTSPKITDFSPKKGTAETLVVIKGENFVPPNPLVKDISGAGIYKLIGTRVLLGGEDVNKYNLKNGKIELKDFKIPQPIVEMSGDNSKLLTLSDYAHSVVLESNIGGNPIYYKMYYDIKTGKNILTDGDKEVYELSIKNNRIHVKKAGNTEKEIDLSTPGQVKIKKGIDEDNDLILNIKTLYETNTDGTVITGNRVKVINNNELIFTVPPKKPGGYYDLAIVNPDTKKDSRTGNAGFYYFERPLDAITITDIEPNQGSTAGDYYINIKGTKFKDNGGGDKASVIIGGVVIDQKDIEVSPDGTNLRVRVPKYAGDLSKETDTGRKTVPVVVVNPDGASASKEDGFTYVAPISNPKITKLILNKGTAAGGETVVIEGTDFRFFEPFVDLNNNVKWDAKGESDTDGDGEITPNDPEEPFDDLNGNGTWDDLRGKNIQNLSDLDKKILPTIYFGNKTAEIISFTDTTIEVRTPKGEKGSVGVYLVNNDYGVSNKLNFSYEASNPKINTIVPNVGRKQGGDKIEILGENFHESEIEVIKSQNEAEKQKLPIIQFGDSKDINISNRDIPLDAPQNSGRIRDRKSTVKVGNLTVNYDATLNDRKLSFIIEEGSGDNKAIYEFEYDKYDDKEIFLPLKLLKKDGNVNGEAYNGYEYVRIVLEKVTGANTTNRLRIDRGFSPEAKLLNTGHISLNIPSYYTVGKVPVKVINPDGGEATGEFEYKNPDSRPTIINMLNDGREGSLEDNRKIIRVNINGGNIINIIGTDFRQPVKIKIADIPAITQGIEYDPSNEPISTKMTFKMPKVDEKYINSIHRVVIENEDGGTAGSDEATTPIYIQFIKGETEGLRITKVTPNIGPTSGNTRVVIEGNDFRKTMDGYPNEKLKVYFGDGKNQIRVPDENIDWNNTNTTKITLTTPPHAPGSVTIKVENPDGSIAELQNAFTYTSEPKITNIVDPETNMKISTISIEGGQKIKILGNDFMNGARVIFNPKLRKLERDENSTGDVISIGGERYILESGTPGTSVEVLSNGEIIVTTPPGQIDTKGVIVINPDKGATPIYDITYGIPEIGAPQKVTAQLIYDQYIRINWESVKDATQYEIYVIEDGDMEFVGTTELTSFIYKDIESYTTYEFLVKAIGQYGSSKPLDESRSNKVRTGRNVGPKDEDGELGEETVQERVGNTANVIIGSDGFDGNQFTIDLTRGELAGSTEAVVSIPASIIASNNYRQISIIGKDYLIKFSPNVFRNAKITESSKRDNAGVKFKVSPYTGQIELDNNSGGRTVLATQYLLEAHTYVNQDNTPVDYLNSTMEITLDFDVEKADMRKLQNINMSRHDSYNRNWEILYGNKGYNAVTNNINRLGTYTITGSRR